MIRIDGMGNLSKLASLAAAINPNVASGKSINAKKLPANGTRERTDNIAINIKNSPLSAIGCFQKV